MEYGFLIIVLSEFAFPLGWIIALVIGVVLPFFVCAILSIVFNLRDRIVSPLGVSLGVALVAGLRIFSTVSYDVSLTVYSLFLFVVQIVALIFLGILGHILVRKALGKRLGGYEELNLPTKASFDNLVNEIEKILISLGFVRTRRQIVAEGKKALFVGTHSAGPSIKLAIFKLIRDGTCVHATIFESGIDSLETDDLCKETIFSLKGAMRGRYECHSSYGDSAELESYRKEAVEWALSETRPKKTVADIIPSITKHARSFAIVITVAIVVVAVMWYWLKPSELPLYAILTMIAAWIPTLYERKVKRV